MEQMPSRNGSNIERLGALPTICYKLGMGQERYFHLFAWFVLKMKQMPSRNGSNIERLGALLAIC